MIEITRYQKREAKSRIVGLLDFQIDEDRRNISSFAQLQRVRALIQQRNCIARLFGCSEIQENLSSQESQLRMIN